MNLEDFLAVRVTKEQMISVRRAESNYFNLAQMIEQTVVPSAHRTAALRFLLESKMTLIQGITHPQA